MVGFILSILGVQVRRGSSNLGAYLTGAGSADLTGNFKWFVNLEGWSGMAASQAVGGGREEGDKAVAGASSAVGGGGRLLGLSWISGGKRKKRRTVYCILFPTVEIGGEKSTDPLQIFRQLAPRRSQILKCATTLFLLEYTSQ